MNAFRITILVLLTLAVGMMFYFIQVSQPAMQSRHDAHEAEKRSEEVSQQVVQKQNGATHNTALDEELARKREEQMKAAKAQEEAAFREMERRTVEEQARQEQARRQRETEKAVVQTPVIGRVYSCDPHWGVVTIEAMTRKPLPAGLEVFIMREGRAVGEAVVDSIDTESGLYIANLKDIVISTKRKDANPHQGDQVMVIDIPTAAELRGDANGNVLSEDGWFEEATPMSDPIPAVEGETVPAPVHKPVQAPAQTPAAQPAQPAQPATPAPAVQPEQPAVPALTPAPDGLDNDYGLPSLPEVEATLTPVP